MELENNDGDAMYERQSIHNEMGEDKKEFYPGEGPAHDEWHLPIINTIIAFYINVGNLPAEQAEQVVESYENKYEELAMRLDAQGSSLVFIPVRDGHTRIETIHINI